MQHSWTEERRRRQPTATNGVQVLHLSVAICVLNDTYREAARLGIEIDGTAVEADDGFDANGTRPESTTPSRSMRGLPPGIWSGSVVSWTMLPRFRRRSVQAHPSPGTIVFRCGAILA